MKISKTPFFLLGLIVLLIVAAAALGFASQFSLDTKNESTTMRDFSLFETQGFFFQGNVFELAIADTPQLREQGLSYVINMQENEGMLFVFEDASTYGFWMKGMQFPLDIMWLNPEGVVVYLEENLSPDTYPETFAPNIPSLYVLEMNVGFIEKYDVKVGDKLL